MTPEEIRAYRMGKGLSQRAFAEIVGASDARTIRRWESGNRAAPLMLFQLIAALDEIDRLNRERDEAR